VSQVTFRAITACYGDLSPRQRRPRSDYHGRVHPEVSRRGRRALLLLWLASGGCSFRAGYDELAACGTDPALCPTDAAVDPPAPDADPAAPDAAVSPLGCGSVQLLRDRFDGAISAIWVPRGQGGGVASQAGGTLVLGLAAGSDTSAIASLSSRNAYDLTGSELAVTVLATGGQRTALEVRDSAGRGAALAVADDVLTAETLDGDSVSVRVATVYDPSRHRYWRLRETGGALFWETSADRSTWAALISGSVGMDVTDAYAVLLARGQRAEASAAVIDDLNLPVASTPGHCKVGAIRDGFAGDSVALDWSPWVGSGTCTIAAASGAAVLTFPGTGGSFCGVDTDHLYDLTDDALAFAILAAPADPTFVTFGELVTPDQVNRIDVRISDGTVRMRQVSGGSAVTSSSIDYDPVAHRHWRLREAGGRVFWDTSPDGASWTNRAAADLQVEVTAMFFTLAGGHDAPGPGGTPVVRAGRVNQ
jgi:hypothetical protein